MAGAVQRENTQGGSSFSVTEHLLADTAMVSVMDMLDTLAVIKVDAFVALTLAGPDEGSETHRCLKRLSDTIEAAIDGLRALRGLPGTNGGSNSDATSSNRQTAERR